MNPQSDNSSQLPQPAVPDAGQELLSAIAPPALSPTAVPTGSAAVSATERESLEAIIAKGIQLMEQSNVNPYHQNRALQLLKAQYIAERYHINLKVVSN